MEGLKGLTAQDRANWEKEYSSQIQGYTPEQIDRVYKNFKFKEKFGSRDDYETLKKYSPEQRDSLYNEDLKIQPLDTRDQQQKLTDSISQAFGKDQQFQQESEQIYSKYSNYPATARKELDTFDKIATEVSPYYKKYKGTEYLPFSEEEKLKMAADYNAAKSAYGEQEANNILRRQMQNTASKNQSVWEKYWNGFKGMGAQTAGALIGAAGMVKGAIDYIGDEENPELNAFQDFMDHVIDNSWTRYGNDVMQYGSLKDADIQEAKKTGLSNIPIIRTTSEEEGSILDNILSVNTIPELINQQGFTIASMLSGAGLSTISNKAFQGIRGLTLAANRAGTLNNLERVNTVLRGLQQVQQKTNAFIIPSLVGTIEGVSEGLNTKIQFLDDAKELIAQNQAKAVNDEFNRRVQNPEELSKQGYNPQSQQDLERLYKDIYDSYAPQYEESIKRAETNAAKAGVYNMGLNSMINGALNMTLKAGLQTPSVQEALRRSRLGRLFNPEEFQVNKAGRVVPSYGKLKSIMNVAQEPIGEFSEEYLQSVTDAFARGGAEHNLQNFIKNKYEGDGKNAVDESLADDFFAASRAAGDAMTSKETILSGIYGALASGMGTPTINNRRGPAVRMQDESNLQYALRRSPVTYRNPIWEAVQEQREALSERAEASEVLNNWIQTPTNKAKYDGLVGTFNWAKNMEDASGRNDEFDYRNNELGKTINDVMMLDKLKGSEYYNSFMTDLTKAANAEEGSEEAQALVEQFKNAPNNRDIDKDDSEILQTIKKNSSKLLDTMSKIQQESESIDKMLGNAADEDTKQALIYGKLTMDDWRERATKLENELSEIQIAPTTESSLSDRQKEMLVNYGSVSKANKEYLKLNERISELKNDIANIEGRKNLGTKEENTLKLKRASIKTLERQAKKIAEIGESFEGSPVLNESEIMSLNPADRATILNPDNKSKYSEEQQAIIDNVIKEGTLRYNDFVDKVEDAGRINIAQQSYLTQYNAILSDPSSFNAFSNRIKERVANDNTKKKYEYLRDIEDYPTFVSKLDKAYRGADIRERQIISNILKGTSNYDRFIQDNKTLDGMFDQLESNEKFSELNENDRNLLKTSMQFLVDKGISPTDVVAAEVLNTVDENGTPELINYVNEVNGRLPEGSQISLSDLGEITQLFNDVLQEHSKNITEVEKVNKPVVPTPTVPEASKPPKEVGLFAQITENPELIAEKDLMQDSPDTTPNSDTVGGSPVALEYLLEGGRGSIENAGYFLHGVAAAFPAITNEIESIRGSIDSANLGMNPSSFVSSGHSSIFQIENMIKATYGKQGVEIYKELLANSTGFYSKEGKSISSKIESLKPMDNSRSAIITEKYENNSNEEVAQAALDALEIANKASSVYDDVKPQVRQILDELGDSEYDNPSTLSEALITKANQLQIQSEKGGDTFDKTASLLKQMAVKMEKEVEEAPKKEVKKEVASTPDMTVELRRNNGLIITAQVENHPNSTVGQAYRSFGIGDFLRKGSITPKTPVMFISDPAIVNSTKQELADIYNEEDHLPIMAVVEDSNGPITLGDKKYQPIGFMPRTSANTQGAARMNPIRQLAINQQDGQLIKDKDGKVITTNGYVRANPPAHTKAGTPNTLIHQIMRNDMDASERAKMDDLNTPMAERQAIYKKAKDSILSKIQRISKDAKKERIHLAYVTSNMKGGEQEFELYVAAPQNSVSRNGRPMAEVLNSGSPEEIISANSRISRYTKTLEDTFKKAPFDQEMRFKREDGVLVPTGETATKLSSIAENLGKKLSNFITLPKGYEYTLTPTDNIVEGNRMYQLSVSNGTNTIPLAEVTNGIMTDTTKAQTIRNLILSDGNFRYEGSQPFAKWQVNYSDFNAKEGESDEARKMRLSNINDIFNDNILESSRESLKYTIRGVEINSPFSQEGVRVSPTPVVSNPNNATQGKPLNTPVITTTDQVKVGDAIVDSESGSILQGEIKPITNPAVEKAKEIADRIVEDSKNIRLADDGSGYVNEEGIRYARVTSIIQADELAGERFDPNSPWITPSTNIGTGVDEFVRDFFAGEFFNDKGEISNDYHFDYPNATQEQWKSFAKQLLGLKNSLDSKGLTVIPRDVTVTGTIGVKDNKGQVYNIPVAGTLDLLAYDDKGNFHIFDMKTNRSGISEEKRNKYAKQVSMYSKFLEDKYGIKVASLNIIPINVTYPTPLGFRDGKVKYEVESGNQLLANGKEYKEAKPMLEETGSVPFTNVNIQYDKLTESEKQIITDMLPAEVTVEKVEVPEPESTINKNLGLKMGKVKNRFAKPVKKGPLITPSSNNWESISDEVRQAAVIMGYTKESWNEMSEEEKKHQKECLE